MANLFLPNWVPLEQKTEGKRKTKPKRVKKLGMRKARQLSNLRSKDKKSATIGGSCSFAILRRSFRIKKSYSAKEFFNFSTICRWYAEFIANCWESGWMKCSNLVTVRSPIRKGFGNIYTPFSLRFKKSDLIVFRCLWMFDIKMFSLVQFFQTILARNRWRTKN